MSGGFHDVEMPDTAAVSVRRVTHFKTDIVETGSGFEYRNALHGRARHSYVLESGPRAPAELRPLVQFFEARQGRQYGFLLRDWLQPHSGAGDAPTDADQGVTPLDASGRLFGLHLASKDGGVSVRPIFKPVAESVLLACNGRRLQPQEDFVLNAADGTVRLTRPLADGDALTAGFFFYVPVRFDADRMELMRRAGGLAELAPLTVVEIPLRRTAG